MICDHLTSVSLQLDRHLRRLFSEARNKNKSAPLQVSMELMNYYLQGIP